MKTAKSYGSITKLFFVGVISVFLTGCGLFGGNDPEYQVADLQGLWLENGDTTTGHYVRFTTEQSDETNYLYGREWTTSEWEESSMTYEEYLLWNREKLGHPGNGWFKYYLETSGSLHELHLMDNDGAVIPKEYVVTKLTATELEYHEKDYKNIKFRFTKVVE